MRSGVDNAFERHIDPLMFAINIPSARISERERFDRALARFDAINREDPARIEFEGESFPAEYLLAQALCYRVLQMNPQASEPLLLASRSQHMRRWEHPRSEYPEGRAGYLKWRADLKKLHADEAANVLTQLGYDRNTLAAVRALNLKQDIKNNSDCQTLEDGLCLVFLQFQYDEIIAKHDEAKVIGILQKTSAKMSQLGINAAMHLDLSPGGRALLEKALG